MRKTILLTLCSIATTAVADRAPPLEEVLVTATRKEHLLLTYSGSVTRLEAPTIAYVGATHHAELLNQAAGAFIQRGSGQESLTALTASRCAR
jgi:iron complex outermembrane receptor protein